MNILVTGAAGFIGSHLADRLLADGHTVAGVDNLLTGRRDNWPGMVDCDITDRAWFYRVANEASPDLIVHCAASYHQPDRWHRDIDTNTGGMVNVVNAARHHNTLVVYFQTALPPISSYAISKTAALQYLELSGVPSMTLRLANVYGPRNLSGPVPTFYRRLAAGQPCTVVDAVRDFVYIDDLVDHVTDQLDDWDAGVHDVHSGVNRRIVDIYRAVTAALGTDGVTPATRMPTPDDVRAMNFHSAPIAAQTPLYEGVKAACDWYADHGVDRTYTHLKELV